MTRYSRQERFAPIGPQGQRRIQAARVLLVGCGALGTHLAEFCVRAGVQSLRIVDRDFVEASNLQRQGLFTENDAARALPKAHAAAARLREMNSGVRIEAVVGDFNHRNALQLAQDATLLLDASDNFEARFLLNDVALKLGVPWVYAACVGARAMCMPVLPGRSACLRCMLEDTPAAGGESCDTAGIVMPAVLQAVTWASIVALKILSGNEQALFCKLMSVDLWTGERTALDAAAPRPDCPACAGRRLDWLEGRRGNRAAVLCGRDSVQISLEGDVDFARVRQHAGAAGRVLADNEHLLRVEVAGAEVTLFRDGRAVVHGTQEEARARAVLARVLGA